LKFFNAGSGEHCEDYLPQNLSEAMEAKNTLSEYQRQMRKFNLAVISSAVLALLVLIALFEWAWSQAF
jgi:hypothetical protein